MKPIILLLLALACSIHAESEKDAMDKENSNSYGPETNDSLNTASTRILPVSVSIFRNHRCIAQGLLVDQRGLLLTKASSSVGASSIKNSTGEIFSVRIRKRSELYDLALWEINSQPKVWQVVSWANEKNRVAEGCWVTCSNDTLTSLELGIISGKLRAIEREGGVMGVVLDEQVAPEEGVLILEVIPQAAADRAGLLAMDKILSIDGKRISSAEMVYDLLSQKDPGDLMVVQVQRKGQIIPLRLTLGHKSVTYDLFNRNLLMSGPISKRKDNFAQVLQHDLAVTREMMGGGLFDPFGNCIGINIARVDRVTNFALPASVVVPVVKKWINDL